MKEIDFKKYDRIDVYAKKERVDIIIKCYQAFYWELYEQCDNPLYADTDNLTFIRPHKIENKDELQYSQIEMENTLNSIGKLEKYKHSKSTVLGLCFGLLSALLLAMAIVFSVNNPLHLGVVLCILSWTAFTTCATATAIITTKKFAWENKFFEIKNEELKQKLFEICKNVR